MTRSASVALAALASLGIIAHLALRYGVGAGAAASALPLQGVLVLGGVPLVLRLVRSAWRGQIRRRPSRRRVDCRLGAAR